MTQTSLTQDPGGKKNDASLTIGELARRTGLGVATLRMWEARHGFPRSHRLPSGHRRYDERTVELVQQVQRQRDAGVRLEAAIAGVARDGEIPAPSVFAELRRRHPHLHPHRVRKATLLALTWALEDECCARAQRPWLFGAFQEARYYEKAQRRWRELTRTAAGAWVLADFGGRVGPADPSAAGGPVRVDLPESAVMRREWSLVCLAPDFPAALAAWEMPGQEGVHDKDRLFESLWTLEPRPVADAARTCARVVADLGPDVSEVLEAADQPLSPFASDLRHASQVFNRVVAYVDRTR